MAKTGELLLNEGKNLLKGKSSLEWVEKLLNKKYDYKAAE